MLFHFQVLHFTIRLLSSPVFYIQRKNQCQELIKFFLDEAISLFGPQIMTLNLHCLRHLTECAVNFGTLEDFSAFPFENFLGRLKRLLRSGNKPLAQVAKRLAELNNSQISKARFNEDANHLLRRLHSGGPLSDDKMQRCWKQFKICQFHSKKITTTHPNNTVMLKNASIVVSNTLPSLML